MKFLLIPIIIYFVNQVIKAFFLWLFKRPIEGNKLFWALVWVGQFPSGHAAVLTSCLTLIFWRYGLGPLSAFCFFVSLMLMYGFLEDRKRQNIFESYFIKSSDKALSTIVKEKILMDFSGHNLADEVFGIIEGLVITLLLINFFRL